MAPLRDSDAVIGTENKFALQTPVSMYWLQGLPILGLKVFSQTQLLRLHFHEKA
jgi:hypothetical protein